MTEQPEYDEANDHSHRDAVNAPLRPETVAALRERLASGDLPTLVVDDPMPPQAAAALAALFDRPSVFEPERPPSPERDGYTIGVYLPPAASEAIRDHLFDTIADATHAAENGQDWDAHVVGLPGDRLGAVDGKVRP